jgi:hypothetical protein
MCTRVLYVTYHHLAVACDVPYLSVIIYVEYNGMYPLA